MSRYYLRSRDLNVEDLANKNEKAKGGLKRKAGGDQEDEATCPKKCMVEALIDSTSELELDPAPHFDYDKENANNPYAVAEFAWDIFRYYKHREAKFRLGGYSSKDFGQHDRAKAVDYMVQMQCSFQLSHETLYLAVKLMDMFLSEAPKLTKTMIALAPALGIFVASKIEERYVPTISDFLELYSGKYSVDQLKQLERLMLRTIGFDLCAPLSYSFLRRYAQVLKVSMKVLTTARYYLETSLHYLRFCQKSESELAGACLLLALRVNECGDWCPILEKYSGYKLADVEPLMLELNRMMHQFAVEYKGLAAVRDKYSDQSYYEVSTLPLLSD